MDKNEMRLKYYKQGLSDAEIARKTGSSKGSISKWRFNHRLPSNSQRVVPKTTLCNSCTFICGNECPSIPVEQRPWVKRFEVVIINQGKDQEYPINYVLECERHKKGRIPLDRYSPEKMAAQEALRGIKGQVIL